MFLFCRYFLLNFRSFDNLNEGADNVPHWWAWSGVAQLGTVLESILIGNLIFWLLIKYFDWWNQGIFKNKTKTLCVLITNNLRSNHNLEYKQDFEPDDDSFFQKHFAIQIFILLFLTINFPFSRRVLTKEVLTWPYFFTSKKFLQP